jgi:hypothetical protein
MPDSRQIAVELASAAFPQRVTVNGVAYPRSDDGRQGSWHYDGESLTARIVLPAQQAGATLTVTTTFPDAAPRIDGLAYRMRRTAAAVPWLKEQWEPPVPLPDDVSLAGQLGRLIDYHPEQLGSLIAAFDARSAKLVQEVNETRAKPEVKAEFARRMRAIR